MGNLSFETDPETIADILNGSDGIGQEEILTALIAACRIISTLQGRIDKLEKGISGCDLSEVLSSQVNLLKQMESLEAAVCLLLEQGKR